MFWKMVPFRIGALMFRFHTQREDSKETKRFLPANDPTTWSLVGKEKPARQEKRLRSAEARSVSAGFDAGSGGKSESPRCLSSFASVFFLDKQEENAEIGGALWLRKVFRKVRKAFRNRVQKGIPF